MASYAYETHEYDVVVVGAGGSGLRATLGMAEQGLKAYRFSIAWSRIFPHNMNETNEKGLQFYDDLIDELLANQIEPVVTLYHWDIPQYLQDEYLGWESRQIIEDFTTYAETVFRRYGDRVKYWVSLNEQNIFISHVTFSIFLRIIRVRNKTSSISSFNFNIISN